MRSAFVYAGTKNRLYLHRPKFKEVPQCANLLRIEKMQRRNQTGNFREGKEYGKDRV